MRTVTFNRDLWSMWHPEGEPPEFTTTALDAVYPQGTLPPGKRRKIVREPLLEPRMVLAIKGKPTRPAVALDMLGVRPMTEYELRRAMGLPESEIREVMERLKLCDKIIPAGLARNRSQLWAVA